MASYFNSRSSFRSRKNIDDVDPMNSMSGIGDVMLVFAVGLMSALVVAWSVDLGQFAEVELGEEIENVEEMEENLESGGGGYVEKGTVYQDPTTGRYYLVQEETNVEASYQNYETEEYIDETNNIATEEAYSSFDESSDVFADEEQEEFFDVESSS